MCARSDRRNDLLAFEARHAVRMVLVRERDADLKLFLEERERRLRPRGTASVEGRWSVDGEEKERLEKERSILEEGRRLKPEKERLLKLEQERQFKLEKERLLKLEQERQLKLEQERQLKLEQERQLKLEQERQLKLEQKERQFKLEQERQFKLEQERQFKLEQERQFKLEKERLLKLEQERQLKLEQERQFKLEQERQLKRKQEQLKVGESRPPHGEKFEQKGKQGFAGVKESKNLPILTEASRIRGWSSNTKLRMQLEVKRAPPELAVPLGKPLVDAEMSPLSSDLPGSVLLTTGSKVVTPLKNMAFLATLNTAIAMNRGGPTSSGRVVPKSSPADSFGQRPVLIHYTKNRAAPPNRRCPLPVLRRP